MMSKFRRFPYRCRACSSRYYQYVAAEGSEVEPERDSETAEEEDRES
jgi:hypothetical protein